MRRWTMFSAAMIGLGLLLSVFLLSSSRAQKAGSPGEKALHRRASFEVMNLASEVRELPLVVGKGSFSLRLEVKDEGRWKSPRRSQVFVAISTRADLHKLKVGELFYAKVDPRVLTTAADEDQTAPFDLDIPLLPGDYIAHVFLCDIDTPYQSDFHHKSFPDAEDFPGAIAHAVAIGVHIDPES